MTDLFIWFIRHPEVRVLAGLSFLALFGFLFFRKSRGTGRFVFGLISIGLAILFWISPLAHLIAFVPLLVVSFFAFRPARSEKPTYIPAVAIVEGGGIKRGLTAPEAAILLEMPLNTVLAAVMVGLVKKGVLQPSGQSPLVMNVNPDYRARGVTTDVQRRAALRREAAQQHAVVLHAYEESFLELLEANNGQALNKLNFTAPVRALVLHTARRVGGYDLDATRDYYQKHLGRARHDVARITANSKDRRLLEHHLEWLVLDEEYARLYHDYQPKWLPEVESGLERWVASLQRELARSVPSGALQVRTMDGERLAIGGEDPLSTDFFSAIYAQAWNE